MNTDSNEQESAIIKHWFTYVFSYLKSNVNIIYYLLFLILLFSYLNLFKNALIDDAFITLNYVKNIIRGGSWGFYSGFLANTATSPLNVILLSIISIFFGVTIEVPILLTFFCFVLISITLNRISLYLFNSNLFGIITTLALVFNPLIISTIGLESILFTALLILSIYCFLIKRWVLLAFVLGMLSITRADGVLFTIIFILFLPTLKIRFRFIGIFILSIAPWYLFSWVYLGSFIPDTFFIKSGQASWDFWTYTNGVVLYFERYPLETFLSFAPLLLLGTLLFKQVRKSILIKLLLMLGLVHFLGYSLLHIPPYHWYYAPDITIIIVSGNISLGIIYQIFCSKTWQKLTLHGVILLCSLIPLLGMTQILARDHFYIKEMPIHTNWATQEQYKEIGLWLKPRNTGKAILTEVEIGTLSYYCDCFLFDWFSDRRMLMDGIHDLVSGQGISAIIYKINFLFLHDNPNYPPYSFRLTGYIDDEKPTNIYIKKWETSTKWIPNCVITYSEY